MYLVRLGFTSCAQLPGLRAVSTSIVELAAAKGGAGQTKLLPPEERLQYLRKAEIRLGNDHSPRAFTAQLYMLAYVYAIYMNLCFTHAWW